MRPRLMWLATCVLGLAARGAGAWELDAEALARLERGRPYVLVRPEPDGQTGLVRGAVDVEAPADVVWAVISDCSLAPRMVASLKSCRVVERDPAGRWDVREQVSRRTLLTPPVRSLVRFEYDPPHAIRFRRAGGDLRVLEGDWRLVPQAGGASTRVLYQSRAVTPFRAPQALVRMVLRHDVPAALLALRREALARKGAPR